MAVTLSGPHITAVTPSLGQKPENVAKPQMWSKRIVLSSQHLQIICLIYHFNGQVSWSRCGNYWPVVVR